MGFTTASPIQAQAIPLVRRGQDVIGQAQTGTGKTAAFGIPLIEKIDSTKRNPQGLVIAPTRELAVQVANELNNIGKYKHIHAMAVYGGEDIGRQIRGLKKHPQIITATPGRLLDHINRKTIHLDQVHTVILDEADEMLNMGFIDDIKKILNQVPTERQTLLFSATMPPAIRNLADQFMKNPDEVKIKAKTLTVDRIDQHFVELKERQKFEVFLRLIDIQSPERAIVFGRTKRRVDELASGLRRLGYKARGLHGDLTQAKRDQVMDDFKNHRVAILVATDVAARGLDISDVSHVYNFDMPQDPESYVHRIGRTGRAGKRGEAITFVITSEKQHLFMIEKTIKKKIERMPIPSQEDAADARRQETTEELLKVLNRGTNSNYRELAEKLLEEHDAVDIIAAALKQLTNEPELRKVKLTDEKPLQSKSFQGRRRRAPRHPRQQHHKGGRPQQRRHHSQPRAKKQ
ncbi:DEAD-box ATP-dependent RNA helicase CshA [Pullulanibacillus camelliae]|uniref:ATP-dependent RNA helicase CshA n=2 Tax=Pullulanibacillus camelliae TaxID=1707096 RepID=A0A8J2VV85_9BACL|nr:DEAD-box ATP-dependent RNA helicase CshA [Pullulanibacillus camelliae]